MNEYLLIKKEAVKSQSSSGIQISGNEDEPTGVVVGPAGDLIGKSVLYDPRTVHEITFKGEKLLVLKENQIIKVL